MTTVQALTIDRLRRNKESDPSIAAECSTPKGGVKLGIKSRFEVEGGAADLGAKSFLKPKKPMAIFLGPRRF